MQEKARGSLAGIRVLDVTHALAGPFCAQVLADQGADVIKIEPPSGDFFRGIGPFLAEDKDREIGGLFQFCNRNKRSVAIDLKRPEGRELLKKLASQADVLIENYRVGVLEKMGLGYSTLKELNPKLVYTSIRGFGDDYGGTSPYRDWPAFDAIAQAMGGWMGVTGFDADHPTKTGAGLGDTVPGLYAALGTLSALWEARSTGLGQYVDISMVDSVFAIAENLSTIFAYTGNSLAPSGNSNTGLSPTGSFQAKDGTIVIAAPHDHLWRDLCTLIDRNDLLADARLATEKDRWANREYITQEIEKFTKNHTKAELKTKFGGKVPFGPVYTAADIYADSHFKARDMIVDVPHPELEQSVRIAGTPVKLSRTPGGVQRRAPCIGEHNEEVLTEYGFSSTEIASFRQAGVVFRSALAERIAGK